MQVTLVQVEIEQALTDYINNQINIKDGMKISIDLKAGRGADGFNAIVDIVPISQVTANKPAPTPEVQEEKPEPKEEKQKAVVEKQKASQTQKSAPATQTAATAATGSATDAGDGKEVLAEVLKDEEPTPVTETAAEPQIEETQEEEVAQEETPKPRPSLFAGLKKATNS